METKRMRKAKGYAPETMAWAESFGRCWRCGRDGWWPGSLAIHHVARGCKRQRDDLSTTVILCQECHIDEHTGDSLGIAGCLALKRKHDPANYSPERFMAVYAPKSTPQYLADMKAAVDAAEE